MVKGELVLESKVASKAYALLETLGIQGIECWL